VNPPAQRRDRFARQIQGRGGGKNKKSLSVLTESGELNLEFSCCAGALGILWSKTARSLLSSSRFTLPELAPCRDLTPGCRGFLGPIPPPLWIKVTTMQLLERSVRGVGGIVNHQFLPIGG
jgi:hypothetical protein